jgi:biopolymer transport protein ExbD
VTFRQLAEAIREGLVDETDLVADPNSRGWTSVGEHPQTAELVPVRSPFRNRHLDEIEADLTPMIDVTLQLVIFFMIAATFTVQKTLNMPQSQQEEQTATVTMEELEQESIVVKLSADGTVLVQKEVVALTDLVGALRRAIRARSNAELILDVDDEVSHDTVVRALDAAGAAQIEKVMFVSRVGPAGGGGEP